MGKGFEFEFKEKTGYDAVNDFTHFTIYIYTYQKHYHTKGQ